MIQASDKPYSIKELSEVIMGGEESVLLHRIDYTVCNNVMTCRTVDGRVENLSGMIEEEIHLSYMWSTEIFKAPPRPKHSLYIVEGFYGRRIANLVFYEAVERFDDFTDIPTGIEISVKFVLLED